MPTSAEDFEFDKLLLLEDDFKTLGSEADITTIKFHRMKINQQLKLMADHIVKVRIKKTDSFPNLGNNRVALNFLYKVDIDSYSYAKGIDIKGKDFII